MADSTDSQSSGFGALFRAGLSGQLVRGVVYSTALGAAIVVGALLSLRLVTTGAGTVEVPNLYNTSLDEALDLLAERELELRKGESRYSPVIPRLHIISQDPLPDTVVRRGRPVVVVVSKGHQYVTVPNVTGRALRAGRIALRQQSLKSGRISWMHHDTDADVILAQSPGPTDPAVRDNAVDLLVSLGPRKRVYRVPNFVGNNIEDSTKVLNRLGLEIGEVETKVDPTLPQGQVLEQTPASGARILEGETVKLLMSIPTEVGRGAEDNFGALIFRSTPGFFKRQVRAEVIDNQGSREVYRQMHLPAEEIMVPFVYRAPATIRVYQDDVLVLERAYE